MLCILSGCEKALPVYDYSRNSLNFDVELDDETNEAVEKNYSFIYSGEDIHKDTLWFKVNTQGFLTDNNRSFELQQINSGETISDAIPGIHYIAFDNAELQSKYYYIPANTNTQKFPVIVIRDASLKNEDVALYFQLKPNDNFDQGIIAYRTVKLIISDNYKKPAGWSEYYFGTYGPVKHKFMIDETGLRWDDEFCSSLNDFGYIQYLTMTLYQRLKVVNAERKKQGLEVLKETDGREVKFDFGGSF